MWISCWNILTSLALLAAAFPETSGPRIIQHIVSAREARNASAHSNLKKLMKEGCGICSRKEEAYCTSGDVISDHCCCDSKYREKIPYVEHTCYVEDEPCQPLAKNCEEYAVILTCCCHRILFSKSKNMACSNNCVVTTLLTLVIFIISCAVR